MSASKGNGGRIWNWPSPVTKPLYKFIPRNPFPEDWARLQNNLGTAYSQRIQGERGQNLELAIACYEAALQVRTPEAFPEKWAKTRNNLGIAYRNRIQGETRQESGNGDRLLPSRITSLYPGCLSQRLGNNPK